MEEKIKEFINDILADNDKEVKNISNTDNLRDVVGLTSFDLAALTVMIEDEFDVDVFENQMVFTVSEITEVIKKES